MPLVYPALTPKYSIFMDLDLGLGLIFFSRKTVLCKSLQFVAQNFTPENIQAVSMKNPDGGL